MDDASKTFFSCFAECPKCLARGPYAPTKRLALKGWNKFLGKGERALDLALAMLRYSRMKNKKRAARLLATEWPEKEAKCAAFLLFQKTKTAHKGAVKVKRRRL